MESFARPVSREEEKTGSRNKVVGKKKLTARLIGENDDKEIFSVKVSPDGILLAAACGDGSIRVNNNKYPIACLRFRPTSTHHKTKNILLAGGSDGYLRHWHVTTERCVQSINEDGNQIFAVDYRPDAEKFATGGKDFKIRIYDESSKSLVSTLSGGQGDETAGHANRIFAVKFHPKDSNILISGGWDGTVQIWDIRSSHSVRSIFGPHICGDSLDIFEERILSGSWRTKDSLQLWDFGSGRLIENINWQSSNPKETCLIYAAQFSKNGEFILAGGSGTNEAKIFHHESLKVVAEMTGFKKPIYSVDMSDDGRMFAIGGQNALCIFDSYSLFSK